MNEIAIIFGRFNPPHKGHLYAWKLASESPLWYIGSNTNTVGKDDPLPFAVKQKAIEALWPQAASHFVAENNWLSMANSVYEKHGENSVLKLVTDEDWVPKLVNQYNGVAGRHGSYKFAKIEVVRPPRLSSATALRNAVKSGDRAAFASAAGVPSDFEVAGVPYFDLVAKYLLPYSEETVTEDNLNIQFHDKLNPALFDEEGKMLSNVRHKLLEIADDFKESLGIPIDGLKDVTVSGSNAAYNYTPTSDIDLHLVVDVPRVDNDDLYRELFDAKKFQYNATHTYKIKGYDVELYVQNAKDPHYSLGIYSLMDDDWVTIPKVSKTGYDPETTVLKYEKLKALILMAVRKQDADLAARLRAIIKKYRAAGLKESGEFGPENLAFKGLRANGYIEKLYSLIAGLKDKTLSLETVEEAAPVDTMLQTYANWPGGANKWITNKVTKLDRIVADLRKNPYAPEMKIFGEAATDNDEIPDEINVFIDTKNIQLDKPVAKEALADLIKISERFYNMVNPYVLIRGKVYMRDPRATKLVQAPQMAARQMTAAGKTGVPLTLFNRSFKSIAYAGMAESLEEANMSPGALLAFGSSETAKSMKMGFEAELIVPGVARWNEEDYDEGPGYSRYDYDDEDEWERDQEEREPTEFEKSAENVAAKLSAALNVPVKVNNQHGGAKDGRMWYVEPDSSINDGEEGGLEFISPPMQFDTGMQKLHRFFDWARSYQCQSDESTGFHVGISVPEKLTSEIDSLKLILFLGDEYVLDSFGRLSNKFAKSSFAKIQNLLSDPVKLSQAMTIMRSGLSQYAVQSLQSLLIQKDKYVSVNLKKSYIEFRSAGGDYLNQQELIVNTILRYVKAFSIAADPTAERKEYAKKLYKLLDQESTPNSVQLFSLFSSGNLSKEQLIAKLRPKVVEPVAEPAAVAQPTESVLLPTFTKVLAETADETALAFNELQRLIDELMS